MAAAAEQDLARGLQRNARIVGTNANEVAALLDLGLVVSGIVVIDAFLGEQAAQPAGGGADRSADPCRFGNGRGGDGAGSGKRSDARDGERGNAEQAAEAGAGAPLSAPLLLAPPSLSPSLPSVDSSPWRPTIEIALSLTPAERSSEIARSASSRLSNTADAIRSFMKLSPVED
jgi:hypothetical protein